MQEALSKSLSDLKTRFEKAHDSLKKESRILRFSRAFDEKMSMENVADFVCNLLSNPITTNDAKIRLLKLVMENASAADAKTAEHDLAGVQLDDLHAAMFASALEVFLKDGDFFLSVAYQVFEKNPELWGRLEAEPPNTKRIEVKVSHAD